MKWAITLIISADEKIEDRVKRILEHLFSLSSEFKLLLKEIDATGPVGNKFTQLLNNNNDKIAIGKEELIELFSEDGQVFELNLIINNSQSYRIIIRDGDIVDIVGEKEMITEDVIGKFESMDPNLY
jgi:hypothetical protein